MLEPIRAVLGAVGVGHPEVVASQSQLWPQANAAEAGSLIEIKENKIFGNATCAVTANYNHRKSVKCVYLGLSIKTVSFNGVPVQTYAGVTAPFIFDSLPQLNNLAKAVSAAHTFLKKTPKDPKLAKNMNYYKTLMDVDPHLIDHEEQPYEVRPYMTIPMIEAQVGFSAGVKIEP